MRVQARYQSRHLCLLQHFIPEPDELGLTHICDVSTRDAQKICRLCLIELTALYDHHSLTWQRRRGSKKYKGRSSGRATWVGTEGAGR